MMDLVSAVVPTRYRPELVMRAVRSALGQTYPRVEVIVVVDGEDEQTVKQLAEFGSDLVKVVALPQSAGGSEARNIGAREASGRWIAFLDDDDEWLPQKLEQQVAAARKIEGEVLLGCLFVERTENGDRILPLRAPRSEEPISEYLYCPDKFSVGEGFVQTSTIFVSRSLLLRIPFVKGLPCGQETTWLLLAGGMGGATLQIVPIVGAIFHDDASRARTSAKPRWRALHAWAQANRSCFTPKAYSFFVATTSATYARKSGESGSVLLGLLRELLFEGQATPKCVALFLLRGLLSSSLRRRCGAAVRHFGRNVRLAYTAGKP